jgi:hypothetical protein
MECVVWNGVWCVVTTSASGRRASHLVVGHELLSEFDGAGGGSPAAGSQSPSPSTLLGVVLPLDVDIARLKQPGQGRRRSNETRAPEIERKGGREQQEQVLSEGIAHLRRSGAAAKLLREDSGVPTSSGRRERV